MPVSTITTKNRITGMAAIQNISLSILEETCKIPAIMNHGFSLLDLGM